MNKFEFEGILLKIEDIKNPKDNKILFKKLFFTELPEGTVHHRILDYDMKDTFFINRAYKITAKEVHKRNQKGFMNFFKVLKKRQEILYEEPEFNCEKDLNNKEE